MGTLLAQLPRRTATGPSLRLAATALLTGHLVLVNSWNNWRYAVPRDQGRLIRIFVDQAAEQEALRGGRARVKGRLERGKWSITLEPPAPERPPRDFR